jgi:hypothetical protein
LVYISRQEQTSDGHGGFVNRPSRRGFLASVASMTLIATTLTVPTIAQSPQVALNGPGATATVRVTTGTIVGTAWKGETTPYPGARIRLRNLHTGRAMARTDADADGRFRFLQVDPAPYVVELMSEQDKVLAVGDLFSVSAGSEATTLVRLTSKTPWLGGFFGNAAAAAVSAASTLGVTAAGSSGRPASVQ